MVERRAFGMLPSGEGVEEVVIRGGGLTASILSYGALIRDLRLEGHGPALVLGFERLEDYLAHSPFFGATPGRCANRVAKGRCIIDGVSIELERNEKGIGHLHGGSDGLAVRNWSIQSLSDDAVTLAIVDPDGRAGYPGNCTVHATYRLLHDGVLAVRYEAQTDRATLANLCQHSYFNLDGTADVLDHDLTIDALHYLPVNEETIPTGEQRSVEGTVFDFRAPKRVGRDKIDGQTVGYDHNFCLSAKRVAKRAVACLHSPLSGVSMQVNTTEPGVQFYAGWKMDVPVPGLDGRRYGPYAGLCLETQIWPDAVNQPDFPEAVLRPGERLVQETDYIFRKG